MIATVIVSASFAMTSQAQAASPCPAGFRLAKARSALGNTSANTAAKCVPIKPKDRPRGRSNDGGKKPEPVVFKPDPYEYAYTYSCPGGNAGNLVPGQITGESCEQATAACAEEGDGAQPELRVYRRLRTGGPWEFTGVSCGPRDLPPGAQPPPAIPTQGQIIEAFRSLPFAKPTVNIQPEGDVTLVNLPTYFEAQWPSRGLGPGDISPKVQLLSWSIEFRIDPAAYNYDFGDGASSGRTNDLGGPYPEGKIQHSYEEPSEAAVKVDAELTGSYRVNGGANWIPLGGVADLQDEPVVTLQIREAKARLYGSQ
ncbi:hypothetical protein ACOCJ7_09570 [Knoellia sp. CPCC 206453]|uniref:hypothetical protein n=1 Tax=Knoellia pratensis TaxID=3404796 RepID=UPI003620FFB5